MVTSGGGPPRAADTKMVRATRAADHGLTGANRLPAGQARPCPRARLPATKRWLAVSLVGRPSRGWRSASPRRMLEPCSEWPALRQLELAERDRPGPQC